MQADEIKQCLACLQLEPRGIKILETWLVWRGMWAAGASGPPAPRGARARSHVPAGNAWCVLRVSPRPGLGASPLCCMALRSRPRKRELTPGSAARARARSPAKAALPLIGAGAPRVSRYIFLLRPGLLWPLMTAMRHETWMEFKAST